MKKLLFHCSEFNVKILDPINYSENAICFSENSFVSALGQWLYIFEYEILNNNFGLKQLNSGGLTSYYKGMDISYKFASKPLGKEYRIFYKIDVEKYALFVVENFNVLDGVFESRFQEEIINRERINCMGK